MKVYVERNKNEQEINFKGTAEELLKQLNINSEEVIISKNNKLITLEDEIGEEDTIKILSVISGG